MGLLNKAARRALRSGMMFTVPDAEFGLSPAALRQMAYERRYPGRGWNQSYGATDKSGRHYVWHETDRSDKANAKEILQHIVDDYEMKPTPEKLRYILGQVKAIRERDLRTGTNFIRDMYGLTKQRRRWLGGT